jgi:hypothetical protein
MPAIHVTRSSVILALLFVAACGSDKKGTNPVDCTDPDESRCRSDVSCTPSQRRCNVGREIQECRADGSGWAPIATCAMGQNCTGGQCDPAACTAGQSMCSADGKVSTCLGDVGTFSLPKACDAGKICVGNTCQPQACNPNQRFCEGDKVVRQCDALGSQSTVAEMCPGNSKCDGGGCKSPCLAAEAKHTSIGCSFYGVDNDSIGADDTFEVDFGLANDTDQPGQVKVEVREPSGWRSVCTVTLSPHEARLIGMNKNDPGNCPVDEPTENLIDRHIEDSGYIPGAAFRITSEVPIAAYQFNSNDQIRAYSSGGTVLLPTHALGRLYYSSVMPQPDPALLFYAPGGSQTDIAHGQIVIIGTVDGTKVKITPKAPVLAGPNVMATPAGQVVEYVVDEGAVLQLASTATGDDLSGSRIESDQPIAVFGNNECATVFPRNAMNPGFRDVYCDHTEEALLPVQAWGKNFVGARVRPHAESPGALDATVWRIVASEDNTKVTMVGPMGVVTMPPITDTIMMNAGEVRDVAVMLTSFEQPSDIELHADKPVFILGYMSGETVATTAVPVEQFLSKYTFIVPGKFRSQLTVVRPRGVKVKLDGMVMGDNLFVPSGGDFEVGRLDFERDDAIGGAPATHTIETEAGPDGMAPKIGIEVRGMDEDCSYGYSGGLSIELINPIG